MRVIMTPLIVTSEQGESTRNLPIGQIRKVMGGPGTGLTGLVVEPSYEALHHRGCDRRRPGYSVKPVASRHAR